MGVRLKGTELEYFPVPKIACTSIKQAVFAHNEPEVAATMRQPKSKDRNFISFVLDGRPYRSVHQLYPARRLGYHWWPRTDARLRFCVVRDPLERFLSGYRNRVVFYNDLQMPEPPQLDEFLDRFDEFRKIPIIRQHFAPMVRFLGIRPGFYDQIFNIRQLDEMVEYCAKHGANLTVPHEQTGGPRIQASDLTAGMKKKIVRHYRWDYRIYGKHVRSGQ